MDWFFALEAPTQVAIVGVLAGVVTAMGAVGVAAVHARRSSPGGAGSGGAELAVVTLDSVAVKQVAAALEAINTTITQHNKIVGEGGNEMVSVIEDFTKELEELRREIRSMSDKLRSRP